MARDQSEREADAAPAPARRRWGGPEIITLVSSVILVAGFAAIAVVLQARQTGPATPNFAMTLAPATTADGGDYQLPVTVSNIGNAGATQVTVTVELVLPDASPEAASLVIDVLPAGASDEAVVLFSADPAGGEVRARVVSYLLP